MGTQALSLKIINNLFTKPISEPPRATRMEAVWVEHGRSKMTNDQVPNY